MAGKVECMDFPRKELSEKQTGFWNKCDATIDGMLGGYGSIHGVDTAGSLAFIKRLFPDDNVIAQGRALDCGAGIGRITQSVLIPAGFKAVDLMDGCEKFLETAKANIDPAYLRDTYVSSFDDFSFRDTGHTYTLIWMQWCAIYLRDDEFIDFFARACASLDPATPSYVVLKENHLRQDGSPLPDEEDHSVTRSDAHMKRLWQQAGVEVVAEENQKGLPSSIFPVRMYALRPIAK
jgi:protein N-terminal methyltransferase